MNYIFLDIDGVMNNKIDWISKVNNKGEIFKGHRMFCDKAWQMLSDVCKETGARIILSSSWRLGLKDYVNNRYSEYTLQGRLLQYFDKYNIPLVGLTTDRYDKRGEQILEYITNNLNGLTDAWVVLDDELFDMKDILSMDHVFKTEFETGLQQEHCKGIIDYFNNH